MKVPSKIFGYILFCKFKKIDADTPKVKQPLPNDLRRFLERYRMKKNPQPQMFYKLASVEEKAVIKRNNAVNCAIRRRKVLLAKILLVTTWLTII